MSKLQVHNGQPCPYCQRAMDLQTRGLEPTRDHYPIPRSRGGAKMVICCRDCNGIKGDMSADAWSAFMTANPEWWAYTTVEERRRLRRAQHREETLSAKFGPKGARVIRQPEKPSEPLRAAMQTAQQVQLTRMVALGFDRTFGASRRGRR